MSAMRFAATTTPSDDEAAGMTRELISSLGPPGKRKYGYNRAVQVGNLVMVAGTTAVDEHGKVVAPGIPTARRS
jgi:enamine deaminase RidA (YjgF/YER057c/UK114 family)